MAEKKVKKFSEVRATQMPLLSELQDETFVIESFTITDSGTFGDRADIVTDKGNYATFSKVLIQQLQGIEQAKAFPCEVTLRIDRRKRYHTFE